MFGIAKKYSYQDANKRTSYLGALTFLRMNGYGVQTSPEDIIAFMLDVANDFMDEPAIEAWLEVRATPVTSHYASH